MNKHRLYYFFIMTIIACVFFPFTTIAELTLKSYINLTIQSLKYQISHNNLLINNHIQMESLQADKVNSKLYNKSVKSLFELYDITEKEYLLYRGKHEKEINQYLSKNPKIKKQIEELINQRDSLLHHYESIKVKKNMPSFDGLLFREQNELK